MRSEVLEVEDTRNRLRDIVFIQAMSGRRVSVMVTLGPGNAIVLGATMDGHGHCRFVDDGSRSERT